MINVVIILKKKPIYLYEKETSNKAIIGNLADESMKRTQEYLKYGCNSFETKRPLCRPLSVFKREDILEYIKTRSLKYSKIYDMGYDRTGCMFCMFGIHLDKPINRFQRMSKTHPNIHKYCIDKLNLKEVLEYIGVAYKMPTKIKLKS